MIAPRISISRAPTRCCSVRRSRRARLHALFPAKRFPCGEAFAFFAAGLGGYFLQLHCLQHRERVLASALTQVVKSRAVFFEPLVDLGEEFVFPLRVVDLAAARFDLAG